MEQNHDLKRKSICIFVKLKGREEFKLRVGDYRVIASIDDKHKRIEVLLIGHRKNIYKKF